MRLGLHIRYMWDSDPHVGHRRSVLALDVVCVVATWLFFSFPDILSTDLVIS